MMPDTPYARWGKPFFDRTLAAAGLLVLSPLLVGLALAVRTKLGGPVLFRQERPGLGGEPFTLIKFRTMTDARGPDGALLPDAERLPAFGQFLRSTSLDELPELWNVLRGEMSLVGPRPLLSKYLPYYTTRESQRHDVRPGITGWAQVNGRNVAGWDRRLSLDVWYVENVSLALDLRIICLTFKRVVSREGVEVDPRSIMQDLDRERKDDE